MFYNWFIGFVGKCESSICLSFFSFLVFVVVLGSKFHVDPFLRKVFFFHTFYTFHLFTVFLIGFYFSYQYVSCFYFVFELFLKQSYNYCIVIQHFILHKLEKNFDGGGLVVFVQFSNLNFPRVPENVFFSIPNVSANDDYFLEFSLKRYNYGNRSVFLTGIFFLK